MTKRLIVSLSTALIVAASVLFAVSPVAAVSGTVTIAVSGGSAHNVGDSIRITPTQTGITAIQCDYHVLIEGRDQLGNAWRAPDGDGSATASEFTIQAAPVAGLCPSWTFTLPNPNTMVVAPGGASMTVQLIVNDGTDQVTANAAINYAASTATPRASSSLPVMLWTLDDSSPAMGQTVHMTMLSLGIASSSVEMLVGGCIFSGSTATGLYPGSIGSGSSCSVNNGAMSPLASPFTVSWTQNGEMAVLIGTMNQSGGGTLALTTTRVFDPPATTPTATPTPEPTPAPTATPAPAATVAPSAAPTPTPHPSQAVMLPNTATAGPAGGFDPIGGLMDLLMKIVGFAVIGLVIYAVVKGGGSSSHTAKVPLEPKRTEHDSLYDALLAAKAAGHTEVRAERADEPIDAAIARVKDSRQTGEFIFTLYSPERGAVSIVQPFGNEDPLCVTVRPVRQ